MDDFWTKIASGGSFMNQNLIQWTISELKMILVDNICSLKYIWTKIDSGGQFLN